MPAADRRRAAVNARRTPPGLDTIERTFSFVLTASDLLGISPLVKSAPKSSCGWLVVEQALFCPPRARASSAICTPLCKYKYL